MDRHVSESHQPGSTYQKINDDYIDADMEMLCAFTSPEKQLGVELSSAQYDYVYKIVSDSTANNDDVQVYVKNFATGNEYTPVEAFYTVKLWKSGFNEFNIYVPTTKTYYLNHIVGAPMCDVQPQKALYRKNLKSVNLANQQISAQ